MRTNSYTARGSGYCFLVRWLQSPASTTMRKLISANGNSRVILLLSASRSGASWLAELCASSARLS